MSSTENTEPKVGETKAPEAESKPLASSSVFSMFGGGAKKEKKEDDDRGDVSGSAKAQREAAAAAKGDDEVRTFLDAYSVRTPTNRPVIRINLRSRKMSSSLLSFDSPRKSTP